MKAKHPETSFRGYQFVDFMGVVLAKNNAYGHQQFRTFEQVLATDS